MRAVTAYLAARGEGQTGHVAGVALQGLTELQPPAPDLDNFVPSAGDDCASIWRHFHNHGRAFMRPATRHQPHSLRGSGLNVPEADKPIVAARH